MNTKISKRIRETRLNKGLTQKDLALVLNRSAQAISEIERNRVKINADDLFKLANLMDKPIEYFYGVDYDNESIEKIIYLLRKMPEDLQNLQLPLIISMLEFENQVSEIREGDFESDDAIEEYAYEFYSYLIKHLSSLDKVKKEVIKTKEKIEQALGIMD